MLKPLGNITQVSKVSKTAPTLRTSLPIELARKAGVDEGDSLIWSEATVQGKKGLFARKIE
jgi:hypothetical protein